MSWQDRDYSDETYGEPVGTSSGLRRPPPATLTLMILHGTALVLMLLLRASPDGSAILANIALQGVGLHPLGILLHPLATPSLLTAAFAVWALWALGRRLEPLCGVRTFVATYVVANLVAGSLYFVIAWFAPALATAPLEYPVGALAAYCLIAGRRFRHDHVLILGRLTSLATMYAVGAAVVVAMALLGERLGALAWVSAALAGAASADVVELATAWLQSLRRSGARTVRSGTPPSRPAAGQRATGTRGKAQPNAPSQAVTDEPEIDDILAKINREGLHALTEEERARLEAARAAKLRRSGH
jgi:membrane associated rhomboid family serine protease